MNNASALNVSTSHVGTCPYFFFFSFTPQVIISIYDDVITIVIEFHHLSYNFSNLNCFHCTSLAGIHLQIKADQNNVMGSDTLFTVHIFIYDNDR